MLGLLTIIMNGSIAFDYELRFATIEVGDIVSKLMLSPEFETEELAIAQELPEQFFGASLA